MVVQDWAGWLVLLATYALIFHCKEARNNTRLLMALLLVLTLHQTVALTNAYFIRVISATVDAATIHRDAVNIALHQLQHKLSPETFFYRSFLAYIYQLFGPSLLLGEELSVVAFLLSCLLLVKIYRMLGYSKYLALLILLYGSLPSMIFMTSITLRESWQILIFMLIVYCWAQHLFFEKLFAWFGVFIFSILLVLFHEGMIIFVFLLTGVALCYQLNKLGHRQYSRIVIASVLLTTLVVVVAAVLLRENSNKTPELAAFHALMRGNSIDFIAQFHTHAMSFNPRTGYDVTVDASSATKAVLAMGKGFIYYLFAPFPWQVTNVMDMYAFSESCWRLLLIIMGLRVWYYSQGLQRKQLTFIVLNYFLMVVLWSLGTLNYGTSLRHHLVSYWILMLLFGAHCSFVAGRREHLT